MDDANYIPSAEALARTTQVRLPESTQDFLLKKLKQTYGLDSLNELKDEGSMYFVGLFDWARREPKLGLLLKHEMMMYKHHLNGDESVYGGWVVNMMHSVGQQLINQDINVYRINVLFRSDRATRLLALPTFGFYGEEGKEVDFNCIALGIKSR